MEQNISPLAGSQAPGSKAGMIAVSVGLLIVGGIVGYLLAKPGNQATQTPTTSTETTQWESKAFPEYGVEISYETDMYVEIPPKEEHEILHVTNLAYIGISEKSDRGVVSVYIDENVNCTEETTSRTLSSGTWQTCIFYADGPTLAVLYKMIPGRKDYLVLQTMEDPLTGGNIVALASSVKFLAEN